MLASIAALAAPPLALADSREAGQMVANPLEGAGTTTAGALVMRPKAGGVAQVLGARAVATASNSLAGGFQISNPTTVYIMVRGNSLRDLGINTTTYLDYPRVRIFNAQGQDVVFDINGNAGFNQCTSANSIAATVVSYYTNQRGQPPNARDACAAFVFQPGVYTFGVQPSIPGVTVPNGYTSSDLPSGDTLFEITLNP
jgi:hypothetical protein